ncbi:MAG: hypothetical protein KME35_00755 [Aphanocapsa sp. GSE-SYN-MK-11-07L]|jgi:hypothetical protein|nr:hypothetical protein [Aphanocapsa sp. GSE-SYN-MK-11-07L]
MQASPTKSDVIWRQVWGLSALLSAIIFSWIIYGIYQPQILRTTVLEPDNKKQSLCSAIYLRQVSLSDIVAK